MKSAALSLYLSLGLVFIFRFIPILMLNLAFTLMPIFMFALMFTFTPIFLYIF